MVALLEMIKWHRHTVNDLAYSPNGRYLASASRDQAVVLWDAVTWRPLQTLRGHTNAVYNVCFTQDSRFLLSGGGGSEVFVWKIPEHFHQTWPLHKESVVIARAPGRSTRGQHSQIAYTADGKWLAATRHWTQAPDNKPKGFTLRSPRNLEIDRVLLEEQPAIGGVRCSPVDPDLIAVGDRSEGSLRLLQASEDRVLRHVEVFPGAYVFPVCFSASGEFLLVVAYKDETSKCAVYRVGDLSEAASWILPTRVKAAAMSPDASQVVVAERRGYRYLQRGQSADLADRFSEDRDVYAFGYSPDGKRLAVTFAYSPILLIDTATRQPAGQLTGHVQHVRSVRFSPDGKRLASAGSGTAEAVKLWDVATGREILSLDVEGEGYDNRQIEWSPDGNAILVMGAGGDVCIWQAPAFADTR